ncbi:MAG: ATP-binding protein [Thermosynechococcaceae cyanobacterium]
MSFEPSFAHCASLQVVSSLDALTDVISWFDQWSFNLSDPYLRIEAQTALIEGFTNVVQHAHTDLPGSTPIEMQIQIDDPLFQIMIWDQGPPYDFAEAMCQLTTAAAPDLNPLNREKHWGQVLFLRLATERKWRFVYERLPDHRNCLLMERALTLTEKIV